MQESKLKNTQINLGALVAVGLLLLAMMTEVGCNSSQNETAVKAVEPAENVAKEAQQPTKAKNIVFFGNSLTAAYGLSDMSKGYVALIQQRLDSLGLPYQTVNAGRSGDTTAEGKERVDWVIKQPVDIFVLELGGNDALRGIEPEASFKNLDSIISKVKLRYPSAKVVLAGMQAPPNLGERYTNEFKGIYPKLAQKHGAALIPFFLEAVGGIPELNQKDRIHPNEQAQYILRETVWKVLGPLVATG